MLFTLFPLKLKLQTPLSVTQGWGVLYMALMVMHIVTSVLVLLRVFYFKCSQLLQCIYSRLPLSQTLKGNGKLFDSGGSR